MAKINALRWRKSVRCYWSASLRNISNWIGYRILEFHNSNWIFAYHSWTEKRTTEGRNGMPQIAGDFAKEMSWNAHMAKYAKQGAKYSHGISYAYYSWTASSSTAIGRSTGSESGSTNWLEGNENDISKDQLTHCWAIWKCTTSGNPSVACIWACTTLWAWTCTCTCTCTMQAHIQYSNLQHEQWTLNMKRDPVIRTPIGPPTGHAYYISTVRSSCLFSLKIPSQIQQCPMFIIALKK